MMWEEAEKKKDDEVIKSVSIRFKIIHWFADVYNKKIIIWII